MPTATGTTSLTAKLHANRGMIFPLACVGLLLVLLVPLPAALLDLLLVFNLTLSVIILVTTIFVASPREFAVFPSLLLAVTLFRLVLNVATTRLILGGDGTEDSGGQVVQTFSHFVTSGSVAVGAILFLIIFVIQFVVITKGGSRISEVAARFVLDALPGKQMAIDADLNAGVITRQQAHDRREAISREADFYSSMDGAGKFVRGDAIAGVVITIVNILGGMYVGMFEHGMQLPECLRIYTKLTIGDGLVSQIPAFIVALGAGLIVTRSSSGGSDLGEDVIGQILSKPKALVVAAMFLGVLAFMGMPPAPLVIIGGGCAALAYVLTRRKPATVAQVLEEQAEATAQPAVERLLDLDVLELEIGPGLVKLADPNRGGDLLLRVAGVREQIALELGVIVPAVGIRDSERLGVNDYAIRLRGQTIARGIAYPDQFLAIDNGDATGAIAHGDETAEPARHRLAYWITESQQDEAERLGYVIAEAPAVIVNHLTEVLRTHAHELLTRQAVRSLLDNLKTRAGAVVEEVVPNQIKPGELQRVLQNLLRERVPIRDLETILETVGDYAGRTHDTDLLSEYARVALGRTICRQYVDEQDRLLCLMLDAGLEELIAGHVEQSESAAGLPSVHGHGGGHGAAFGGAINTMPPATAQRIGHELTDAAAQFARGGVPPVVLCAPVVRSAVRKLLEPLAPHVAVLSLAEVVGDVTPEVVGVVGHTSMGDAMGVQHVGDHGGDNGDLGVEDGYESTNV